MTEVSKVPTLDEILKTLPERNGVLTIADLAKIAHLSHVTTSKKRKQGKSDRQIVREGYARLRASVAKARMASVAELRGSLVGAAEEEAAPAVDVEIEEDDDALVTDKVPIGADGAESDTSSDPPAELSPSASFADAQRAKEFELWRKNKIANDEKEGKLLDADLVRRVWARIAVDLRNNLLSIPNNVAKICAVESDPFAVRNIIDDAIKQALETFPEQVEVYLP
jgi:hypothetical protein